MAGTTRNHDILGLKNILGLMGLMTRTYGNAKV